MESSRPRQHRQGVVPTLVRALIPCFIATSAWAAGPRINFDIPAGEAKQALQLFIQQSNVTGLYEIDTIENITTNGVHGDFDAGQALEMLLKDKHVVFGFEEGSFYIKPIEQAGGGEARVVDLPEASVQRPEDYDHRDGLRPLYALREEDLEEVTVTGSHIRGALEIVSPLEIISIRDLSKAPYATVQDAMQGLLSNSGALIGEDTAGGNFLRGTAANLRGLGSGATLVLVNYRRQAFSGIQGDYVDLSSIPFSAVERIEVLPDGASALYGSDAVAGVVNVILKSKLDGGETQLRAGSAGGGASEKLLSQTFGKTWESGNFLASYQYLERSALNAVDRRYSASSDKRPFGGDDFRTVMSSPGNILDPRSGMPTHAITDDGQFIAGGANYANRFEELDLLPERKMHSVYTNLEQGFGERLSVFGEARFGTREVESAGSRGGTVLQVTSSNPFFRSPDPQATSVFVGYNLSRDLPPIRFDATAKTYSLASGATYEIGETWKLTASASYGSEDIEYEAQNQIDAGRLRVALAESDREKAFDPFTGLTGRQTLEAITSTLGETAQTAITSGSVVADGTVMNWSQGAIRLAVGGEWRKEGLIRTVTGEKTGSFDRHVESAFAELSVPIVGDPEQPKAAPRLELSLAGRYERYDDFGSTWNPKIGVRWAPIDSLKLRTSWGTSFRAPQLFDLYYTHRNTAEILPLTDPTSPTRSTLALAILGSNPDLKEETASTWTAGLDIAPRAIPNLTISMTYYSIDYQDRIINPDSTTSPARILLQEDVWQEIITRNPSLSQIASICDSDIYQDDPTQCRSAPIGAIVDIRSRNLSAMAVRGVDLKIDHIIQSRVGAFQFGLNGNYVFDFEQKLTSRSSAIDLIDTVNNPLALRLRATADWYQRGWDRPGFGMNLTLSHAGAYHDALPAGTRVVEDFSSVDLRLSYRTSPAAYLGEVEFGLNGSNIFNESPPFVNRDLGYDVVNANPYGRVVSFSLQKMW